MILIVGLGNPGKKYEKTRHNIGSRAVDEIAANFQLPSFREAKAKVKKKETSSTSIFNFQSIFNAKISKGTFKDKDTILVKPQTFMNLSGKSVKTLMSFYKITLPGLVVIHDDMDIPLGKIRIVKNRGAAGHKGVESTIRELGTKNFVRFRIGICPKTGKPKNPERFVLQKFNKEEEKIAKEVIQRTVLGIEMALKSGLEKAMSKFNK